MEKSISDRCEILGRKNIEVTEDGKVRDIIKMICQRILNQRNWIL